MAGNAPTIAVLGAGGFIGSAVARAAAAIPDWKVRALTRQPGPLRTDVRDRVAVEGALAAADTVIHAANYIGNDPSLCAAVNVRGTKNVIDGAARQRARVVYVSTAAVYGHQPYRRLAERDGRHDPQSPLSASRAAAEQLVLDADGIVIRPHLVIGNFDRWAGPGIASLTSAAGGLIDGGIAPHSIIEVDLLGELAAQLATAEKPAQTVYHAAHLDPLPARQIIQLLWPQHPALGSVDLSTARQAVAGSPSAAALRLFAVEHTLDTSAAAAILPALRDAPRLPASALEWYRQFLP